MTKDHVKLFAKALHEELIAHRVLVAIVILYALFALVLGHRFDREVDLFLYLGFLLGTMGAVVLWFGYLRVVRLVGRGVRRGFLRVLYTEIKRDVSLQQVSGGLVVFGLCSVFFSAFQSVKMMIPAVQPFRYDVLFSDLDRILHFGALPHELLQPVLGSLPITLALQFFYTIWLLVMMGMLAWQMLDRRRPQLRMQYLVTFLLAWFFIGSIAAIQLSSAGPVYFDRVTGLEGPYGAHMAWLWSLNEIIPISTLDLQNTLWDYYTGAALSEGSGISAMPSMHVSIAMLFFLFARRAGRWAAWGAGIFLVVILLGSVHLAWHYAIDGYLAIVLMTALWWAVGRFYPESEALPGFEPVKSPGLQGDSDSA